MLAFLVGWLVDEIDRGEVKAVILLLYTVEELTTDGCSLQCVFTASLIRINNIN